MPHGEFRLHNTRTALARLATVSGAGGIVAAAAGFAYNPYWYILGTLGIVLAALYTVIALRYPLIVTLSGAGLTARGRDGVGVVPASAIEAVGISKVNHINYVTLWYDTAAVPSLPPVFDRYLRAMPSATPGTLFAGALSATDDAARIDELCRLVRETGLGEWRDIVI